MTFNLILRNINIESVTEPVEHGEGPFWDAEKKVLYFVDLLKGGINKYDPNTGDLQRLDLGQIKSLVVVGKLLLITLQRRSFSFQMDP